MCRCMIPRCQRAKVLFVLIFVLLVPFSVDADSISWIKYIESAHPFKVIFDRTQSKFDDSHYTGDWRTDPMGVLKGGETYTVVYKNGKFICTGYNQGIGKAGTWSYSNANPRNNQISLWGRIYVFDGQGRVYDMDYGLVGHMIRWEKPQSFGNFPFQKLGITGRWQTNCGIITFTQNGNKVIGTYTHDNGRIEGTLQGNIFRGKWMEAPTYKPKHDAGDVEFIFSHDGKSFKGYWRYGFGGSSWQGTWNGTKIE